jgi:hypothetical protein
MLSTGCTEGGSIEFKLDQFCKSFDIELQNFSYFVFINVDACDSCADSIKDFLTVNSDNDRLLIVLSSVSKKKCQFILSDISGKFHAVIDQEQKGLKTYSLVYLTPVVYVKAQERIITEEYNLTDFSHLWLQGKYPL